MLSSRINFSKSLEVFCSRMVSSTAPSGGGTSGMGGKLEACWCLGCSWGDALFSIMLTEDVEVSGESLGRGESWSPPIKTVLMWEDGSDSAATSAAIFVRVLVSVMVVETMVPVSWDEAELIPEVEEPKESDDPTVDWLYRRPFNSLSFDEIFLEDPLIALETFQLNLFKIAVGPWDWLGRWESISPTVWYRFSNRRPLFNASCRKFWDVSESPEVPKSIGDEQVPRSSGTPCEELNTSASSEGSSARGGVIDEWKESLSNEPGACPFMETTDEVWARAGELFLADEGLCSSVKEEARDTLDPEEPGVQSL